MKTLSTVCVFCGASPGLDPLFGKAAHELGALIAEQKLELVYGGGNSGLMGELARAASTNGARVTGVIPERLHALVDHVALSELIVTPDMHSRKMRMYELSEAFIVLPGGIGTMEECFEVFTWKQLGYHDKPLALLNVASFFTPFLTLLDHMVAQGFLGPAHRNSLIVSDNPHVLLESLRSVLLETAPR